MEMKTRSKEFREIFPIMTIRDGIVISKRGDVTIGWRLTLPSMYSLDRAAYADLHNRFYRALRDLPEWTMVHRQDVFQKKGYRPRAGRSFLDRAYQRNFMDREHLVHEQYIFITLTNRYTAVR